MADDGSPLTIARTRRAGRPTSEETGQLNEKILQAAFTLFAQEGYGGATIEQIAQKSHTTRRSVLSRFPDKESLLLAVVEMRVRRVERALQPPEILTLVKPLEALKQACQSMLELAVDADGLAFYRLCLAHVGKFPQITAMTMQWNDRWAAELKSIIERSQRGGAFAGRDPEMLATGLIGAFISNPANRAALGDPQFHDPAGLRRYFDGMWSLIRDLS